MSFQRNHHRLIAAFIFIALLIPTFAAEAATKQVNKQVNKQATKQLNRLKLATLAPRGSSFHKILLGMQQEWVKTLGPDVSMTIYTDGTQGGEADVVSKMRIDSIHGALLTSTGLAEIDQSVRALGTMPMMFRSLEEFDYVSERLRPRLDKVLADEGFVVLFWSDAGWVRFFSKTPISTLSDLKKTKLFTWAGDSRQVDLMKATGFHPVPLETAEILTGLKTGMINAVPTIPHVAVAGQFYRPAPHMLELNWAPLVGALVVTRKTWDSFSPATRTALQQAAATAGARMKAASRAESNAAVVSMKARGLKVQTLDARAVEAWRQEIEKAYPRIRGTLVPKGLFDEVVRLLAERRTGSEAGR